MPQVASLPIDEPVGLPHASPQQFGSAGETVAGLGQETLDMALGNEQFERHLIEAQRQLKYKQIEINVGRLESQAHEALSKAVTPEEAQAVHAQFKQQVDDMLSPLASDKALAPHLHIYGQQVDVEMQNTVNTKKADIINKGDKLANQELGEKSVQSAINVGASGGDYAEQREQYDLKTKASVYPMGTLLPQQQEAMMRKWDADVQAGILDANINSPNPLVRRKAIDQLKTGKGPLDLSTLDQSQRNQYLSHAEETDKRLTQLAEVQNHNADLNNAHKAFQAAPFVGPDGQQNYPAMRAAVQDGKWLTEHGMYTTDPNTGEVIPDYERGEKLLPAIGAGEATAYQAAKDDADKKRDEIFQHFGKGDISGGLALANKYRADFEKAKVDYYPSIIAQTKSWSEFQISEARAARAEQTAEQAQERLNITDLGFATSGQLQKRFTNGETLDYDRDIYPNVLAKKMNIQQANELWEAIQHSEKDPDFNAGLTIIGHSPLDLATQAKLQGDYSKQFRKEGLTGDAAITRAQKLVDEAGKQATGGFIQRLFNNLRAGTPAVGGQAPTSITPIPKEGATKVNSSGDKVVYRNGKWGSE